MLTLGRNLSLVFVVAAFLATPQGATAGPLFPNPVYTVGFNPYGMGKADFNRDGIQDLVVANAGNVYDGGTGDLSLLLGRGDGTFASEVRVPTAEHASDVLAADFDGDGTGDLILIYIASGRAVLMRGAGNGTFGPETLIAMNVARLRVANINGDAVPDLLKDGASVPGYFQALIGQGDGTFGAAPVVGGSISNPVAADVNEDGRDDVLVMTYVSGFDPNEILVYLGAGDGTFALAGRITTGEYSHLALPADLDGDGHLDLGVDTIHSDDPCCGFTGPFILYYGRGDGSFVRGASFDGVTAYALFAADLNGDGHQDYVRIGDFDVNPFLGDGNRNYTAQPYFYTGSNITRAIASDFEGDGRVDLAILANTSEAVFIYAGNGVGGFGPPINQTIRDSFLGGLVTDDFNGDGHTDIAASLLLDDQVAILPGHGDGSFGPEVRFPAGVGPVFLASADMNVDGRKDLVVSLRNWHDQYPDVLPPSSVAVLLGNGDGTFQAPLSFQAGIYSGAMHVADLDGNGFPDVVVANWGDGVDITPDLSLFLGNGDGTLGPETRLPVGAENHYPYGWTFPTAVSSGDLDNDGRVDLVVAMNGLLDPGVAGAVRVLPGLGAGAFGGPVTVAETASSSDVSVIDLDGDGAKDIVVADAASYISLNPGGLYVLHNNGSGTFTASSLLPAGVGPIDVQAVDLTGDGLLDLAASNNAGYLAILTGITGGGYADAINFGLFGIPLAVVNGDFDGDGLKDMLIVSQSGVFVLRNQTPVPLRIDATVAFGAKGVGTLSWTTNAERDLTGFNLIEETNRGPRQLNVLTIPCEECVTGAGRTYTFPMPKHKNGRNLFVDAVHSDGRVERFGPALRQ